MKIAVVNFSGNVGKTTTTVQLLAPRLPSYRLVTLETSNTGSVLIDARKIDAKRFEDVFEEIIVNEKIILDIGSSNIEATFSGLVAWEGLHHDIAFYIVPCTADDKIQTDTYRTIERLAEHGVKPQRIRIVLNRVTGTTPEEILREFKILSDFATLTKLCVVDAALAIPESPLFDSLEEIGIPLSAVLNLDEKKLRDDIAANGPEKPTALKMLSIQMRGKAMLKTLDGVFAALKLK